MLFAVLQALLSHLLPLLLVFNSLMLLWSYLDRQIIASTKKCIHRKGKQVEVLFKIRSLINCCWKKGMCLKKYEVWDVLGVRMAYVKVYPCMKLLFKVLTICHN